MRYSSKRHQTPPTALTRHRDWDVRLVKFIKEVMNKPFTWGEHDCLTFANNAVIAQRGYGFADKYLGKYKTVIGATGAYGRWLESSGCSNIVEGLDQQFERVEGFPPRGSIVAMPAPQGAVFDYSFGVMASQFAAFVAEEGLVMVKPTNEFIAWRVS